jgi:hypothetical protein
METMRPNQALKPTALLRGNFSVFITTPWISSRLPASLVQFASSRSRTPAVMLFNASRGLSYAPCASASIVNPAYSLLQSSMIVLVRPGFCSLVCLDPTIAKAWRSAR